MRVYRLKKQSKKSKIINGTCLFLLRLLCWCIEGYLYFWTQFTLYDYKPEFDEVQVPWTIFIVIALAMGVLEAVVVHKRWNDETVSKKVLVLKSVVIVFLPILLYYLIFYVVFPVSTMLGIGVYN